MKCVSRNVVATDLIVRSPLSKKNLIIFAVKLK